MPDSPALTVNVDRTLARDVGIGQQAVASDVLVSLNNSAQVAPNFWLNPKNGVSYPLVVQTPTYQHQLRPGSVDASRYRAGGERSVSC